MAFAAVPSSPEALYEGLVKSLKGDDAEYLMVCMRALQTPPTNVRMDGDDLLTMAIKNNARYCIEPLRRNGFSLDRFSEKEGKNPLEEAMDAKATVVLEVLLKYGANPNSPHTRYGTIMHAAAATRMVDSLIPVLCSRKGDPNAIDPRDGSTPLHTAVLNVQVLNLEQLLERGANINAMDHQGRTPLHLAIGLDEYDPIAFVLLDRGADSLIKDLSGMTPLDLAKVREEVPLIKSLEERSSLEMLLQPSAPMARVNPYPAEEFRKELLAAVEKGNGAAIREMILERGGDVWPPTSVADQSPLLKAFVNQRLDLAALLIAYKLGVSDRGANRRNAVHYLLGATNQISTIVPFLKALHQISNLYAKEPDKNGLKPVDAAIADGVDLKKEQIESLINSMK